MRKFIILLVITTGLFFTGVSSSYAARTALAVPDSALLYYRSGSTLLYDTYRTNGSALANLNRFVNTNRDAISSGRYHIALYGYITSGEVGNKRAINTASIQASVVRSYLKSRLRISHSCFTFDIDTTQNRSNMVQVQLVRTPIQAYSNTAINYSESSNLGSIARAFAEYKNGIPYTSYFMVLAKREALGMHGSELYAIGSHNSQHTSYDDEDQYYEPISDSIEVESKTVAGYYIKSTDGGFEAAPKDALAIGTHVIYVQADDGRYVPASQKQLVAFAPNSTEATVLENYGLYQQEGLVRTEPYAAAKDGAAQRDYPVVGIKTNLVYWLGAMPNAEMEFYIGKRFSLGFEGSYAWLSDILGKDKAYYLWGVGAEFRVWFKSNRVFNGFYAGVYGQAGQFDFKLSNVGNQGDYFGGGLSFGYVLPLGKHFNMEFGLGLGYISYGDTKYKWDGTLNQNVFISKAERSYIGPTKLKVSLMWKF